MPNSAHKLTVALSAAQLQAVQDAAGAVDISVSELTRTALRLFITRAEYMRDDFTRIDWPDDLPPARSGVARYNDSRRKS